jgi:hypothetical protein
VRLKVNYLKCRSGRQMLRRWERERDLDALIALLENGVVPKELLKALRAYRNNAAPLRRHRDGTTSTGRADLERLLFWKRRGRGGNPVARSIAREGTEQSYAVILAAQKAGWRGEKRFSEAARFMRQSGFLATRERLDDCAARLRRLYYRRRKRGPLDAFHRQLVAFFSGLMLSPHARPVNPDLVRKIAELKKLRPA